MGKLCFHSTRAARAAGKKLFLIILSNVFSRITSQISKIAPVIIFNHRSLLPRPSPPRKKFPPWKWIVRRVKTYPRRENFLKPGGKNFLISRDYRYLEFWSSLNIGSRRALSVLGIEEKGSRERWTIDCRLRSQGRLRTLPILKITKQTRARSRQMGWRCGGREYRHPL